MAKYECDRCGACCAGHLIVEAEGVDVLREARLIEVDPDHCGKPLAVVLHELRHEWKSVLLAGPQPCAFLDGEHRCSIYPTRPNCCVAMEAGDEQCQESRTAAGLPPLPALVDDNTFSNND